MIIDILSNRDGDSPYFTVNTAVTRVPLNKAPTVGLLEQTTGANLFQQKDNIIVLSFGIRMPLGFEIEYEFEAPDGTNCISMFMRFKVGITQFPFTPETVWLPFSNYEMNYGNYYNMDRAEVTDNYSLTTNIIDTAPQVSMINVPAALEGKKYYCPIFWKVAHTLPLIQPT